MERNSHSILKGLGILLLTIFGLWLVYSLLFGMGTGMNVSYGSHYGGGHMNFGYGNGYGYGQTGTIAFLLLFLIKVLFVLFIVGLVVGIVIAIKKYIFTAEDVEKIKSTFTGQKTVVIKETCSICAKELEKDWKVCPHCGKEVNTQNI